MIDNYAFSNCTELRTITIPAGVTAIGYGAFNNCSNLAVVNFEGSEEQWAAISIGGRNDCLRDAQINFRAS